MYLYTKCTVRNRLERLQRLACMCIGITGSMRITQTKAIEMLVDGFISVKMCP